jgi:S1-C subfamily serine protease
LQIPEPTALTDDPVEVYARGKHGVVVVGGLYTCKNCGKFHATVASGFVLTATGAVVTNYHVVNHREIEALVVMTDRREVLPVRRILAANQTDDVAILKVDAEGLTPLPVAAALDAAPVGSPVGVISHPAERFYCYTSGVVSRYSMNQLAEQKADTVWITADFARGSSGAPVLNPKGQVVAVVRSTESIYHGGGAGQRNNLQMIFKTCTPTANLYGLFGSQTWAVPRRDKTM